MNIESALIIRLASIRWHLIVLFAACPLQIWAQPKEGVRVRPVNVYEEREYSIDEKGATIDKESSLIVKLQVDGADVKDAKAYGNLVLLEAVDDLGNRLMLDESRPSNAFQKIHSNAITLERFDRRSLEEHLLNALQKEPRQGFTVDVRLKDSRRNVSGVRSLRGEFQLALGGEEKVVTIEDLQVSATKPISHPDLEAAGLHVRIVSSEMEGGTNHVEVEYSGNGHALKNADFIDARGESISGGGGGWGWSNRFTRKYELSSPIDASTRLQLRVWVGLKTVTVPFHLTNLALP